MENDCPAYEMAAEIGETAIDTGVVGYGRRRAADSGDSRAPGAGSTGGVILRLFAVPCRETVRGSRATLLRMRR